MGKKLFILGLFLFTCFFFTESSHARIKNTYKKAVSKPTVIGKGKNSKYLYLGGKKGLLLCFHGNGGKGENWKNKPENRNYLSYFKSKGYSFICPSSATGTWGNKKFSTGQEVARINKLLDDIGISRNQKIHIVGHSKGGAFASYYTATSRRSIQAVHFANASGLEKIVQNKKWRVPTFYSYARCDRVVSYKKIEKSYYKMFWVRKAAVLLDRRYAYKRDRQCHQFINVASGFYGFINPKPKQRR